MIMKRNENSILDKFTLEELVKMLDEECSALGIPCIKNGQATEFERLTPPTLDFESYTVPASTMLSSVKRSYSSMAAKDNTSLPSWESSTSTVACSILSNLKLAA